MRAGSDCHFPVVTFERCNSIGVREKRVPRLDYSNRCNSIGVRLSRRCTLGATLSKCGEKTKFARFCANFTAGATLSKCGRSSGVCLTQTLYWCNTIEVRVSEPHLSNTVSVSFGATPSECGPKWRHLRYIRPLFCCNTIGVRAVLYY